MKRWFIDPAESVHNRLTEAIKCHTGALLEKRHSCAISTLQRDESLAELQWAPSYKRAAVPLAWHTWKPFACRLWSFSVIMRRWSKSDGAGFGLFLTFALFMQEGLRWDWGMERGVCVISEVQYVNDSHLIPPFLHATYPLWSIPFFCLGLIYRLFRQITVRNAKDKASSRQRETLAAWSILRYMDYMKVSGLEEVLFNRLMSDQQTLWQTIKTGESLNQSPSLWSKLSI